MYVLGVNLKNILIVSVLVFLAKPALSDDHDHKHDSKTQPAQSESKHEHEEGDEDRHDSDHKEEGENHPHDDNKEGHANGKHEEHEENPQVGPGKGILEASEESGIKLSPEAEKNFEIARLKVSQESIEIPKSAIVRAVSEVNVFRYRNGFYKRIDFEQLSRAQNKIFIKSEDLKPGDEVVVSGLGFLRIAEIAAFGGAPKGHSH